MQFLDVKPPREKRPFISIIVVNYNGRFYLPACLDSILSTMGSEAELLVIDNQSTDDSVDIVESYFPRVQLIHNPENSGYAGGNNLGAAYAQGEFLVILNPDTVVKDGWLMPLIRPLQNDLTIGMTTPSLRLMKHPTQMNTAGNNIHLSGLTLCRGMGQPKDAFAETAVVSAVSGAAFAIRRDLFVQLGGFDHRFFMYMEDTDLSLRAQLSGYKLLYVPQSTVLHDYTLTFGPQKTYYQERNRYLMLLKNARWATLVLMLPGLLIAELLTWGFVLMSDRANWQNKPKAYAYIFKNWAKIMHMRRRTQALRQAPDSVWLKLTSTKLDFEQASDGLMAKVAHFILDPFFIVWRHVLLQVIP